MTPRERHRRPLSRLTAIAWALALAICVAPAAGRRRVSSTQPDDAAGAAAPQTQPAGESLPWLTRFADALDASRRTGQPILVDVGADWCVWCRELDRQFQTPEVQQRLKGWTRLRQDADRDADALHNLAIGPLPALRVLTPSGQMVAWHNGYMPANELAAWLDAHVPRARPRQLAQLEQDGPLGPEDVEKVLAELTDRDPVVHEAAARRLLACPNEAAGKVAALFAAGKLRDRVAARELLEAWGAPVQGLDPWNAQTITPAALDALRAWSTGKHAAPAPAKLSAGEREIARHDMAAMLLTGDPAEVEAARERLARFGAALLPEIYAALASAATDRERERLTALRYRAVSTAALALHWEGGFDRLASSDATRRRQALDELGKQVTAADAPLLMELFSDPDPLMRESSLRLLESVGGGAGSGFIRLLHDPEPNVRAAVLKQLAETPDPKLVGEVVKYVAAEKDPDLVVHAIRFLRQVDAKPAMACLQSLLTHESWRVRAEAAEGMGATLQRRSYSGDSDSEAQADIYASMIRLLDDPDGFVVSRALGVLKSARVPAVTQAIAKLGDRRPDLAAEVIKALGTDSRDDELAQQTLRKFLAHKDAAVRSAALTTLGTNATTVDLLPALGDASGRVRLAAAGIVEDLLEQQRPNPITSRELDWEQWLSDYHAAKGRASWTMQVIKPLRKMLASGDENEPVAAALPLVALGDEHDAAAVLRKAAAGNPAQRRKAAGALQWLNWNKRLELFNQLKAASAGDERMVSMLATELAKTPTNQSMPVLWDLLSAPDADLLLASEVQQALVQAATGSSFWNWRNTSSTAGGTALVEACKGMADHGSANQRLVALALLLTASPDDAAAAAKPLVSNGGAGDGLRTAALQVLLLAQTRAEGIKTALANFDAPRSMRKAAVGYLAAGADPIRTIQGEIFLNFQNPQIEFRTFGEGTPIVIEPPAGVTPESLRPLLSDPDPDIVAYASYLLCLGGDMKALPWVVGGWELHRDDATWRKLAYRAIAVSGDDAQTPKLQEIYGSFDQKDTVGIRDFYWTIRVMKGEQVMKLRKRIRDEIGMDSLR